MNLYIQQIRASIDHALATSYRRNIYDGKATFVGHISLVKGIPFFGYHVGYRFFLKIYMLNPLNMTRFVDLLHQGAILNCAFQPFESHLQYLLQWMCDFNLYGCNYIDCKVLKFREPIPDYLEMNSTKHKWHNRTISPSMISDAAEFPRQSHCSIEVDIRVEDILNRHEIQLRDLHHNFVERFAPTGPDEKLVRSMAGLWRDETRRRKRRMGLSDTSSSPFPPEVLISMSADPRSTEKGGWIHEEEFRELVKNLVSDERAKTPDSKVTFDDFVHPQPLEIPIKTALESVEDLFSTNLLSDILDQVSSADGMPSEAVDIATLVNEESIPNFDREDFPYESDEEVARELAMTQGKAVNPEEKPIDEFEAALADEAKSSNQKQSVTTSDLSHNSDAKDTRTSFGTTTTEHHQVSSSEQGTKISFDSTTTESNPITASTSGTATVSIEKKRGELSESKHASKRRKVSGADEKESSGEPAVVVIAAGIDWASSQQRRRATLGADAQGVIQPNISFSRSNRADEPRPSSQLSQASIKANGLSRGATLAFPVVKNAFSPSQEARSNNSDKRPEKTSAAASASFSSLPMSTPQSASKLAGGVVSAKMVIEPQSPKVLKLAGNLCGAFASPDSGRLLCFGKVIPTFEEVGNTLFDIGLPPVIYQDAYYSNEKDVPERAREYAGREFKIESTTVPYLPLFDPTGASPATSGCKLPIVVDYAKEEQTFSRRRQACRLRNWDFAEAAPTYTEVEYWLLQHPRRIIHEKAQNKRSNKSEVSAYEVTRDFNNGPVNQVNENPGNLSQIDGPTQKNRHGFKFTQRQASTSVRHETQYMSTLSLELHVNSRGDLAPNPETDQISCIFWCLKSDDAEMESNGDQPGTRVGIVALSEPAGMVKTLKKQFSFDVIIEDNELDLINHMVDIVREFDPDILTGYEVHNGSWGYMIERARMKYEYNLCDEFSRMKSQSHGRFGKEADRWGFNQTSTIRITGRHMINIWRAMRGELNLLQYTLENVAFHLLHKRVPHYSFRDLTMWYTSKNARDFIKCIHYFLSRVQIDLEILEANELIPRTSEQARLIGVDFFSVFSRGSQYKVESFMFRIAKPENFILVSPNRKQVGQQNALECLPLVMEPQSAFYNSPLLVLDFQSLYPSIMIAYNYCYSTCLGRIVNWRGTNKMGFAEFKRQPRLLELVENSINIAPNGMMYVKPEMRKSLLAKMLGEILETRVMVKSGMKVDKQDKTLQQLLNNRQLALKLLANVTYGYTSASFSGRMPCSEIADSIVQTARETLERAIALIHSVKRWGAEVVYGDTDSLFIYLKGRTKDQAFDIGEDIAKTITSMNPRPVKLKFEKVYFPCVLLAKKRYVGFKYESKSQKEPEFDAKGIETVRRDGTPAEQKIEEKALKILFRTADLSQVKAYFQRQCAKVMMGKVSIQDFCFAREVKLGTYSDRGPPPPGALISTRRMLADPRTEPQYGERVPYVVITGGPGARLIDRCVAPEQLLKEEGGELDAEYYISKNLIPPLERIFNLVGANVRQWYDEMPKVQRIRDMASAPALVLAEGGPNDPFIVHKKTLESYLSSSMCVVCRSKLPPTPKLALEAGGAAPLPLCAACRADPTASVYELTRRLHEAQHRVADIGRICRSCAGLAPLEDVTCDSKDCPVFYTRVKARARERRVEGVVKGVVESDWAKGDEDLEW